MVCASRNGRPAWRSFLAAGAILAIALQGAAAEAVTVKDASSREVRVDDASRIVSIGGAVTEILYALGLEKKIVAIDITSLYPPRAMAEKPNVGYMRALSPEGVLGLNPSLVLATEGSGPKEAIAVLQSAKVPFVLVPDPYSGEGIIEKLNLIAKVTGEETKGACLAARVRSDLDAVAALRKHIDKPVKVLFVLSFVNGRAMVAGRNTAADGIIKLAGGVNAISEYEGYKPINDESVIAANPDFVLAMNRGPESLTAETVFASAAFSATAASARKAFVSMDGLYLLGFGPRTARAARDLAASLYPELHAEKLPSETPGGAAQDCH
jgi:iron complex transport system substrate-binding protein